MGKVNSFKSRRISFSKKNKVSVIIDANEDGISGGNTSKNINRGYTEIGEHLVESPNSNKIEEMIHDMMSPAMGRKTSIMKKF